MATVYPYVGGTPSKAKFDNNSGEALSGGKVYFYVAGTSTPKDTYSDSAGTVLNANPVILDSRGEANIFLLSDQAYKVVIKDSSDVTIYTVDNVSAMVDIYSLSRTDNTSLGDALVGGKRTDANAVAFTLHKYHENRWLNVVVDYGATGDGSTNDTTAIQNAATDLRTSGGGVLYFPSGTYIVNQSILIGSNTRCLGDGDSSVIKAHQSSFVGTAAAKTCYLFRNYDFNAVALSDSDITIENLTFDYGTLTIVGGGAHCISMRYVDRVTVRNVRGIKGENVTAFLACRDTVVDSSHGVDQTNCFFDHWDGSGNCKVIACTGRSSVNIAQGIQFTGTGSSGENRTSTDITVAHCSVYGVRNGAGTSSAIIANASDPDSATYRFNSIGNYIENSDLGLVFEGEGGQHLSLGDTLKDVTYLPIFIKTSNSDNPDNCRVLFPHLIDCDHSAGNVAMVQISGSDNSVRGLRITNTGAVAYDLIARFNADATNCVVELESGADGLTGTVSNAGTNCTYVGANAEGSCTLAITFDTPGNLSAVYDIQVGRYRKDGNKVYVQFMLRTSTFTHTTASGNLRITGMPYTSRNVSNLRAHGALAWQGITKANYTNIVLTLPENVTYMNLYASGSGVGLNNVTAADMPTGGTVALFGSIEYLV